MCPFCKRDPYHYVDIGVGYVPAAIECCDLGIGLFSGHEGFGGKLARRVLRDMQNPSPRAKARAIKVLRELGYKPEKLRKNRPTTPIVLIEPRWKSP